MTKKHGLNFENEIVKSLRCVYCKDRFTVFRKLDTSAILRCSCSKYPLVEGIFFLKENKNIKRAVSYLLKDKEDKALLTLLALRLRLLLPFFVLFLTKVPIYRKLGFSKVIKVLTFFSYNKDWVEYIVKRKKTPTYQMSKIIKTIASKSSRIADVGCGLGQLLGELKQSVKEENIFGLDASALNLYFARKFFAPKNTLLICADVEKGLPFNDSCLDTVSATDAFHYLKKSVFIKEAGRVLKKKGIVILIHTASRKITPFTKMAGIPYLQLSRLLRRNGFQSQSFFSNESLWAKLNQSGSLNLMENDSRMNLDSNFSYSVFAGKENLPPTASLSKNDFSELKKEEIDYRWDPELLETLRLNTLAQKYDRFVFLSPHYDDAVWSCCSLLSLLYGRGSKTFIVTFFTKPSEKPYSIMAKIFLRGCGYTNAAKLFRDRREENIKAAAFLKAKHISLGFVDAAWRKDGKGGHIYKYPEDQFAGEISSKEINILEEAQKEIKKFSSKNTLIFAPLGVGGHVDHVIVREAASTLSHPVIFWEDYPYNVKDATLRDFFSGTKKFEYHFSIGTGDFKNKHKAIKLYKSQFKFHFPDGKIPNIPERYFILRGQEP